MGKRMFFSVVFKWLTLGKQGRDFFCSDLFIFFISKDFATLYTIISHHIPLSLGQHQPVFHAHRGPMGEISWSQKEVNWLQLVLSFKAPFGSSNNTSKVLPDPCCVKEGLCSHSLQCDREEQRHREVMREQICLCLGDFCFLSQQPSRVCYPLHTWPDFLQSEKLRPGEALTFDFNCWGLKKRITWAPPCNLSTAELE